MSTYTGVPSTPLEPTMSISIEQAMRLLAKGLRVCMPARVVAVNGANRVDVRPGFKARFATEAEAVELPLLSQVPIVQPQGNGYAIQLPIAVGDSGMLIFADRCIDTWLAFGPDPQDPNDPRLHDLTDAIFVPGLLATDTAVNQTPNDTDLVLQNGAAKMHVQKAGTYTIGNQAVELVSLVQQLASGVEALAKAAAALKVVGSASVDPVSTTALANASSALSGISTKIASLVGA